MISKLSINSLLLQFETNANNCVSYLHTKGTGKTCVVSPCTEGELLQGPEHGNPNKEGAKEGTTSSINDLVTTYKLELMKL